MEQWNAFLDAYNDVCKKRDEIICFVVDHLDDPQYIVNNIGEVIDGESIGDSLARAEIESKREEGVGAVR